MKVLSTSVFALLACACASGQSAQRPAATAQTEPVPTRGQHIASAATRAEVADAARTAPTTTRAKLADVPGTPANDSAHDDTLHTPTADNTRNNARDRDNPVAVSPLDQGNHTADLEIARKIREAVVGDSSLSLAAKNVKIIAKEGDVTLRGSVKTPAEKHTIERYAHQVAGATHVHDELSVDH